MKLFAVIALIVTGSLNAFADVNPQNIVCEGTLDSGTYVEFIAQQTAIPTYMKAELAFDYREWTAELACTRSADLKNLSCIEKIPGGDKLKVMVTAGKAIVAKETANAQVDRGLGVLNCK
ncbi:hypothetical protein B9G69_000800 [Bdellovibrio sp. SKB1291214]|uniref:hypothetical protein n=1 Tax=Bdellovibrio sp. SKB1291214 TaxID=1732569 RepID=UPI000B5186AC|nr:hypothetical protein [Bdellovibrio sp. SKB1291214]UYL09113.1 hypothetical protein B9G69_000800 [Bdellovibrio sp. SKB1291214]